MFVNKEFEILYFVVKNCLADWNLNDYCINFCDLTLVLDGNVDYYIDNELIHVEKGEAIFIKKGSKRKAQTSFAKVCAFNFNFFSDEINIPKKMKFKNLDFLISEFNKSWCIKNENYILKCNGIFMWIFYELFKEETNESVYIKKIKKYIAENIEKKVTVMELSEKVKLNAVYCGAMFKKETGETITKYINKMKIMRAEEMLLFDNLSISEVAYKLGFEDIFYFSRLFKKINGLSPKQYKKNFKS